MQRVISEITSAKGESRNPWRNPGRTAEERVVGQRNVDDGAPKEKTRRETLKTDCATYYFAFRSLRD